MTATREVQGHAPALAIVRDEAIRLGPQGQLVAVVSHPAEGQARTPRAPAVIVLNAGVLHRVGPHRLHVSLTRHLAGLGFPAVRLDLGGIGDSIASTDATTFWESAVADTREAMTGLGGMLGARRFVIFGVCAGADNALSTALADERVAGIVLVDPAVYPTPRSLYRELRRRLVEPGGAPLALRWAARHARTRLRRELRRLEQWRRGVAGEPPAEGREYPPVEKFGANLAALADRGVGVLACYAGMHGENYNHEDQIFESFPRLRGRIDRAYFSGANHTFTQLDDQAALIATTARWISGRFG
ncbi:MAG TPA: alpha/beta fold hydrolase [Kofleriaceae bacterium]|nr:alpha/beta fold hydrolase [Kofleriaceae bacterium]